MEQSSHRFNSYTYGIASDGKRKPEGAKSFEDLIRDKVLDFEFDLLDLVRDFPAGLQFEALLDLINKRMLRVQNAIRFSLQIEQLAQYPDQRGLTDGRHFESKQKAQEFLKTEAEKDCQFIVYIWENIKKRLESLLSEEDRTEIEMNVNLIHTITVAMQTLEMMKNDTFKLQTLYYLLS